MNSKSILLYLSVILIIIIASCTFNEPVLPNWETIWKLPLPEISYKMSEAIDNEHIFADTLQGIPILSLSIKDTVDKEGVAKEDLSIKPDPDTLSTTIRRINIDSPGKQTTDSVTIHQILGFQINEGDTLNISSGSTITTPTQVVVFTSYNYAMVNTGKLIFEFHNNTLLNITGGMQIDLYDDSTDQFIGTSTFPAISAYSSAFANDSIDIGGGNSGKLISRRLRMQSQVPIQQGDYPVTNNDTSGFTQTDILISNLIVEEAFARIPEQTTSKSGAKSIENRDNRVAQAVVDEGRIRLNIENQLEVEATVIVTLPNFERQTGTPFTKSEVVEASAVTATSINLADLQMHNYQDPGSLIDSLFYEVTVITTPSSGLTHISNNDSVIVRFDADSIFFREFEGIIDTIEMAIDTVNQEDIFDYGSFEGSVKLNDLQLDLTIFNELGIPVDMIVKISGEHKNAQTGQIEDYVELDPVPVAISPGMSGAPSTNLVSLNSSNSRIVELMQILPTDITMTGSVTIMGQGRVTISDSVWGEVEISSPFNVFVDSIPNYYSDINMLDGFDDDIKEAIQKRFQTANLDLNYENTLPVSAGVTIVFAKDTVDFFEVDTSDTSKLIIDNLNFSAGTIGSNGYVSSPSIGSISPEILEKDIKIFSSDTLYVGTIINFPDVNTAMKFQSTDEFIGIGSIKFKVYMNPDEE